MKKNGWGLRVELVFILIFLVCLVIIIIGLNEFGLLGESSKEKLFINDNASYNLMEQDLVKSSKEYVNKYYGADKIDNVLTINYLTLYYNGYIEKLTSNGKECGGYVDIKNVDNNLIYYPYLKCSNYKTYGYDKNKDW